MTKKKCEGIDCAWCTNIECPNEKSKMTDKKNNFEKDINVPSKEQIIISNRRQGKNIYTIKEDVAELEINSKKYAEALYKQKLFKRGNNND